MRRKQTAFPETEGTSVFPQQCSLRGILVLAVKLRFRRSPHIPNGSADEDFFALNDESEFLVELNIFGAVSFEVTGRVFLLEVFEVSLHQRSAESVTLSLRSNANRSEMHVGLFRV